MSSPGQPRSTSALGFVVADDLTGAADTGHEVAARASDPRPGVRRLEGRGPDAGGTPD